VLVENFELRKIGERILLKCPKCGLISEIETTQLAGQRPIKCPMIACDFCTTIDLRSLEPKAIP